MQTRYFKNKVMLSLSTCAILLGLNNLSAVSQSEKLADVKVQQNTELSNTHENRLKSVGNKNQLKNSNKLVNAWKKHDPSIAPFLGSWLAYETIWSIYPSVTKGRVCLIRREMDTAVLDVGQVKNGQIHLQSGWVISPKGDRLEVTASDFGESLKAFGTLEEPSQIRNVNSSYLVPLLKAYKQAGCTASLPNVNEATSSQSKTMTWQELKTFAQQKNFAGLEQMIPSQYPNQFADGQVAITMLNNGGFAYVVAREGVNIPNLSSVKELRQIDGSFSAVEIANAVEFPLPALKDTPDSLYNSSQLIEIVSWASRYDSEGLSSEARQSQQTTLPNGQKAYYLKQGNKYGWCTFMDESAQYSDYLCVNIANSPKTSLELLKSILPNNNTASNSSRSTLPSQELVDAIRKHTNNQNYSDVEYSFFEIDLNGDENKDAIVYETGSHCGQANCYLSIFMKTENQYRLLSGPHILQRYNSKVAILQERNSEWINLAMPAVDWNTIDYGKAKGWRNFKFDGREYANVGESNSINHQTIVDFENAKTFNLSLPGSSS